jgi:hypothetical protein
MNARQNIGARAVKKIAHLAAVSPKTLGQIKMGVTRRKTTACMRRSIHEPRKFVADGGGKGQNRDSAYITRRIACPIDCG